MPEPEPTTTGGGRRLTTITIDQAISSASNVLVTVLAARVLGADSFGMFTMVFLTYVTTQGIARSLVGEPLLVRPHESEERPGEAIGTSCVLGVGLGLVVAVAGALAAIADRDLGTSMLVLGACTPLLVLQDLGRYLGFAVHRPGRALALDVGWLVLLLGAVGLLAVADIASLTWFLLAWAGSGALAGCLLLWQYRHHRIVLGIGWLRETWPFSWRYAMSFATRQGCVLAGSGVLAAILGPSALGAINGALLLFGAQVQLQAAATAAGVTEISRLPGGSPEVGRQVRNVTLFVTVAAAANLVVALVLPDRLGELVLGDTWAVTQLLLLPAGIQVILLALITGVRAALLGMRAIERTLRIDVVASVVGLGATIVGAALWDVRGAFWVRAGGQGVALLLWWAAYRQHEGRGEGSEAVAPAHA